MSGVLVRIVLKSGVDIAMWCPTDDADDADVALDVARSFRCRLSEADFLYGESCFVPGAQLIVRCPEVAWLAVEGHDERPVRLDPSEGTS